MIHRKQQQWLAIATGSTWFRHRWFQVAVAENDGTTALMHAARAGHAAVVKLLLRHGASVLRGEQDGTTPLMAAALGGHVMVAQLLLEHGADARAVEEDGTTTVMGAALDGHVAMVQLLLDRKSVV